MNDTPLRVLTVLGSSRPDSVSATMARTVATEARRLGAATREWDLRGSALPPYDADNDGSEVVGEARSAVAWADALVLATPDYHGGPSGRLKNFLDHFWRELSGKLFAIVVASHEKGLTVQDHLRTTIRQCYGWSLPYGVAASSAAFDDHCRLTDAAVAGRLRMMARDTVVYGALIRAQLHRDLAAGGGPGDIGFAARLLER